MFLDDLPPAAETPEVPPDTEYRHWRGRDLALGVLLLVGGYIVLLTLFAIVSVGFDLELVQDELTYPTVVMLIAFEGWIGIVVLLLARRRRMSAADLGFRVPRGKWVVLLAVLGAYSALAAYAIVVAVLDEFTGADLSGLMEGNPLPSGDYDVLVWVLLGIGVVGVAPVAEELFFRGLVFRVLDTMWPTFLAMLVSGVAFSLLHLNPSVLIPFTLIGIVFAWSFRRADSLWTPIGAHAIVNGVSFMLTVAGVEA